MLVQTQTREGCSPGAGRLSAGGTSLWAVSPPCTGSMRRSASRLARVPRDGSPWVEASRRSAGWGSSISAFVVLESHTRRRTWLQDVAFAHTWSR